MADMLRRSLAPITEEAWKEIDDTAARVIRTQVTARRLVDFVGPKGWDYAAVNLGRLKLSDKAGAGDLPWGIRQVQPLIEVRVPFRLASLSNAVRRLLDTP